MNYAEAEKLIFDQLPNFQKRGSADLKYNLNNIKALCQEIGNPQDRLKCIHVAGTNGKGSCSHFLASILQEQGFSVGLYTSPHLKNYRERFRINGQMASEGTVLEFVNRIQKTIETLNPTFFEVSVALAFYWFEKSNVDFAVIEVGLGGRLDSTNIITPILSVITSIGLDHQKILGDSRAKIATEKAGIIKSGVPVVIGERDDETVEIFTTIAENSNSAIFFSDELICDEINFNNSYLNLTVSSGQQEYILSSPLAGNYQIQNLLTVVKAIEVLNSIISDKILVNAVETGVVNVITNTGFMGRWQKLMENPLVICDTGHNQDAWEILGPQIDGVSVTGTKHAILGFSNDKDVNSIVKFLSNDIKFYFTEFDSNRSMTIDDAQMVPIEFQKFYRNVNVALSEVLKISTTNDFIFIGGSTYVVAEIENL